MNLSTGAAIAAAAQSLVGTPFRLHGRDPRFGLDCVGVASVALHRAGIAHIPPQGYRLRGHNQDGWKDLVGHSNLILADGPIQLGDLLMVRPGPSQLHILVVTDHGRFVHAQAGLRRVVIMPGPPPWPVDSILRAQTPSSGE